MYRLCFDHARNHEYLAARCYAPSFHDFTSVGLLNGSTLTAVVGFSGYNQRNIYAHIAAETKCPHRGFLYAVCGYAFDVLACKRMTGTILATNTPSLRLAKHIGFETEFVMRDGHRDGDMVFVALWKDNCRFLTERYRSHFLTLDFV